MIELKNIVKIFKDGEIEFKALDGINLSINDGEFLIITGPSGSGKSTLLYQIGLLDTPTSGKIIFNGEDTSFLSEKEKTLIRLKKLGYIFQDYALLPELTALENTVLPFLMMGTEKKIAYGKSKEVLSKLGLKDKFNNLPNQLSGGEQQRVSIARAIANKPDIIFADEPTANLDSVKTREVIEIFKLLHKEGQTIAMVTHEEDCFFCSSRMIRLSDGSIVKNNNSEKYPKIQTEFKHKH